MDVVFSICSDVNRFQSHLLKLVSVIIVFVGVDSKVYNVQCWFKLDGVQF